VKDFCCPRCERWFVTAWPSGQAVVTLRLERYFHVGRPDASKTYEPAGLADATLCLSCADALWNQIREFLPRLVREPSGGD
jgi:hypothetical protein